MLTGEENQKLQLGHLRGQAISYFAFALLFMRSYSLNVGSKAPFFSLDTSDRWPIPLPNFHFPDWVPISLACICLFISLFFVSNLIPTRWRTKVVRFSLSWYLTFPFNIMLLAIFVVSWLAGISPLTGLPRPWFDIFYWAGYALFLLFSAHFIQAMTQHRKQLKHGDVGPSVMGSIGRWLRCNPQHNYERQFSPRYWNSKARWQRIKFIIGKNVFGMRSWNSSQRQSFFILIEIIKTVFWKVILAVVLVCILAVVDHFLSPHIAAIRFLPQLDSETTRDFLGIVAQVAGIFLGLYFTAISVVASTVYAKVPGEIRELLTKEKVGNLYIGIVALTVAVATLLLVKGAIGFSIGILDVLLVALLIVMAIFSFVLLGMRIFNFFDFTELAKQLDSELVHWFSAATTKGFEFDEPSFQAHYQRQAERALRTYSGVVMLALEDKHFSGKALTELISRPLLLLQLYVKNKALIPSESQWFRRTYQHRSWLTANYDEVRLALRSGTPLQPELVPDFMWFEGQVGKMIVDIVGALIERHDMGNTSAILDNVQRAQSVLGENLAIDEALHLFRELGPHMKKVTSTEDSVAGAATKYDEDTQLARLSLIDVYCLGLISILLGLSKTLREVGPESFGSQMDDIDWHKSKSVYISSVPREVIKQLEYLQKRLVFEYEVEGKLISPPWYYKQIAAQGMVRFIERTSEGLIKQYEETFAGETDRLVSAQRYLNATQVIQRGLEACDKFIYNLGTIKAAFEQFSSFRRVQDTTWPSPAYEEIARRVLTVREQLISNFAKSSVQLAKMPSKQNWPDYFGQCFSVLAEECNSSMAQGNEKLFGQVFPAFFYATLAAHDRLRTDLAGRSDEAALVFMTEPIEDLLHISGYGLIYSELDGKKYWDIVKGLWDRYLDNHPAPQETVGFINTIVDYRQSIFAILPRAPMRTGWQQRLEKRLREEKILSDDPDYPFMGESRTKPKHPSKIIQAIARGIMGTILHNGQDVFLATYISKRPEASGSTLPRSAQDFLNSLTRLEGNSEPEEDSE